MEQKERTDARQLVEMLRDMSGDPDAAGEDAICAWRTEAAAHGDRKLVAEIDAHDPALLAELWDRGSGYLCEQCGADDPFTKAADWCLNCARMRRTYLGGGQRT